MILTNFALFWVKKLMNAEQRNFKKHQNPAKQIWEMNHATEVALCEVGALCNIARNLSASPDVLRILDIIGSAQVSRYKMHSEEHRNPLRNGKYNPGMDEHLVAGWNEETARKDRRRFSQKLIFINTCMNRQGRSAALGIMQLHYETKSSSIPWLFF